MKKMTFLACAAMLTSLALTGCSGESQNEPGQNVPSVTTDINISLPANATGGVHKMPSATVQTNNGTDDFQGIGNISLIPFGLAKDATVSGTDTKLGKKLADITDITATSQLAAVSKAKKYSNIAVPTGTSAFLFYAQSKATGTKFNIGSLTYVEATTTAGTTKFELEAIHENTTDVTNHDGYKKLLAYVQSVADATDGTKAWKNYTNSDNECFKLLFDEYKTTKNFNSFNIQRMMNDLLATISLTENTLADNMRTAIKNSTYVTYDDGTKKVTLKADDDMNNFPACLNLPDGSVAIAYDADLDGGKFGTSADKEFANRTAGALNVAPTNLYTYPASLWYYANTTISTSNESENAALTDATHDWSWVLGQYAAANGSVNSKTRSIALTTPINYAVGRFDVQVKLSSASLNDAAQPTPTAISCDNKFQLTAVLVGGQKNVGFDFTPASYAGSKTSAYTLYDNVMSASPFNISTTYGSTNHTLVLETTNLGTEVDNVMVAIELKNNTGSDFIGADGVIPDGGKFYLVGKLTASAATTTPKKVFLKDYTTTAQFNIVDLTKAYNGIPDLRTPTLEIGMSVDLAWTAGSTYTIDL